MTILLLVVQEEHALVPLRVRWLGKISDILYSRIDTGNVLQLEHSIAMNVVRYKPEQCKWSTYAFFVIRKYVVASK